MEQFLPPIGDVCAYAANNPFMAYNHIEITRIERDEQGDYRAEVRVENGASVQMTLRRPFTGKATLSARPEQLFFTDEGLPGKVLFSTFLGDFIEYEIELDDGRTLTVNEYTKDTASVHEDGETVHLSFDPQRVSLYEAETGEVLSL